MRTHQCMACTQYNPLLVAVNGRRLVSPTNQGDGMSTRSFKRLTELVAVDPRINWPGMLPVLRQHLLLYTSEVRPPTGCSGCSAKTCTQHGARTHLPLELAGRAAWSSGLGCKLLCGTTTIRCNSTQSL